MVNNFWRVTNCGVLGVLGGFWWFLVILNSPWWFLVVLGGFLWFLMNIGGSWWFFGVLADFLFVFWWIKNLKQNADIKTEHPVFKLLKCIYIGKFTKIKNYI